MPLRVVVSRSPLEALALASGDFGGPPSGGPGRRRTTYLLRREAVQGARGWSGQLPEVK